MKLSKSMELNMDKMPSHDSISIYLWGPIRIAGAYLVVGVLWILFSDKIAERLASSPAILTQISIYKGWGYVVVTALLLYLLIRNHTEKVSKTEQKLHESEENYKELLNNASDGIFIAHANGQYVFVNEEACKLVGYTRNELLSMQVKDLIAPEDLSRSPLRFGQLHKGETHIFERVLVRKDGSRIISELSASILPDGRYQSIVRDITERKVAEKALERSERRYRSLFENMINGFARCQMIYNVDGEPIDFIYLEVNEAFKELTGLQDVIGKRVTDLIPGIRETNPELFAFYGQVAKTGKPRKFESYLAGLRAGAWFSVSAYSMEKGFFMAVFDAITERKQAEQALQRNERLFRLLIEHAPAEIAMFDRNMKYIAASQRYIQDYNLKQKNIIGFSHYEVFPEITDHWKEIHQRCLAGATASSEADPFPRADGTLDWVKWEIHPWYEEENTIGGIILLSELITERMRAEIAVRENEERLRLSLHAANQGLYDLNVQTGNAVVNKEYAEMLGYDPNTFVETNAAWIERLHPDDREIAAKAYSDYINGLTAEYRVEFRQQTRDGNWKWILSLGKVVEHDPDGKPLRMLGTHTDISDRK